MLFRSRKLLCTTSLGRPGVRIPPTHNSLYLTEPTFHESRKVANFMWQKLDFSILTFGALTQWPKCIIIINLNRSQQLHGPFVTFTSIKFAIV